MSNPPVQQAVPTNVDARFGGHNPANVGANRIQLRLMQYDRRELSCEAAACGHAAQLKRQLLDDSPIGCHACDDARGAALVDCS